MNEKNMNQNTGPTGAEAMPKQDKEVDVLYQKLGERWYAFSLIDEEVFAGEVPQEAIRVVRGISEN